MILMPDRSFARSGGGAYVGWKIRERRKQFRFQGGDLTSEMINYSGITKFSAATPTATDRWENGILNNSFGG